MKRARGFSMVELIVVMVLIGIMAAVAMPKLVGDDWAAGLSFRNDVVSALRYAQKSAVSHRRLVCAAVQGASIELTIAPANPAASCSDAYASPDGGAYASSTPSVTTSGAFSNKTLYFQPDGTITTDAGGGAIADGTIGITGQATIRIEGATGYVE